MDLGLGLGSVKVFAKEDAKLERTALGEAVEGDGDDDLTGVLGRESLRDGAATGTGTGTGAGIDGAFVPVSALRRTG